MKVSQKRIDTAENTLPSEEARTELVDGKIYHMAPPSGKHQALIDEIYTVIRDYIRKNHSLFKVYPAPFGVFANRKEHTYMEPDISVIYDPVRLSRKGCAMVPDWIIEIVSPDSRQMDYHTKLFKYRSGGVRVYWIVDPEKNRITTWNFETNTTEEFSFKDSVPTDISDDLNIDFFKINL